ncbi:hypothetical protein NA56DRAFT_699473 [Hyaloscypha hepaticicola]|uniref:Uncharacterized protein n=1 Tax=Hyaloscypha hepaticicola TaxID=2082293 RepID=A0A2J6QGY6_9HELO|nr:hypothetical protein NA56DRAFT_699473 [Hyaloscypha hepaticicola]
MSTDQVVDSYSSPSIDSILNFNAPIWSHKTIEKLVQYKKINLLNCLLLAIFTALTFIGMAQVSGCEQRVTFT